MRCKFCGSEAVHSDTQHTNFSGKKAAAGVFAFGLWGAGAGLIGKNVDGYRCGYCGAFSEELMSYVLDAEISTAISAAKWGKPALYLQLKAQYPGIETVVVNSTSSDTNSAWNVASHHTDKGIEEKKTETFHIKKVSKGTIKLGKWPCSRNGIPLEWLIVGERNDELLLVSKYIIEVREYKKNRSTEDVRWDNCSIREWLNSDFYNNAFDEEEKNAIVCNYNDISKTPKSDEDPGNGTYDNVFLLSYEEVMNLLNDDEVVAGSNPLFDGKNAVSTYMGCSSKSSWLLRSKGKENGGLLSFYEIREGRIAAQIGKYGFISYETYNAPIRPAMWIKSHSMKSVMSNQQKYKTDSGWETICYGNWEIPYRKEGKNAKLPLAPIEWLVLAKEEDRMLLLSKCNITERPYNESKCSITWENSSIRRWLNNTFFKKAFNNTEQDRIIEVLNQSPRNPEYATDPGNETLDKVFLLSVDDVNKYLGTFDERLSFSPKPLVFRECWGCTTDSWMLRSPYKSADTVTYVSFDGLFSYDAVSIKGGVRPAIWVKIE